MSDQSNLRTRRDQIITKGTWEKLENLRSAIELLTGKRTIFIETTGNGGSIYGMVQIDGRYNHLEAFWIESILTGFRIKDVISEFNDNDLFNHVRFIDLPTTLVVWSPNQVDSKGNPSCWMYGGINGRKERELSSVFSILNYSL